MTHGTRARYQAGCHCLPCRAANADYFRQWYKAKQTGDTPLGTRIPAARTHILMKVIRTEGIANQEFASYMGWSGNYSRVKKAKRVTLRTALKVARFYRMRVTDSGADSCVSE